MAQPSDPYLMLGLGPREKPDTSTFKKQMAAHHGAIQAWYAFDVAVVLEPDGFFRAIDQNTYDVDCDHTGFFSNSPTGYGRTPLDAIVDLLDTIDGRTAT